MFFYFLFLEHPTRIELIFSGYKAEVMTVIRRMHICFQGYQSRTKVSITVSSCLT